MVTNPNLVIWIVTRPQHKINWSISIHINIYNRQQKYWTTFNLENDAFRFSTTYSIFLHVAIIFRYPWPPIQCCVGTVVCRV